MDLRNVSSAAVYDSLVQLVSASFCGAYGHQTLTMAVACRPIPAIPAWRLATALSILTLLLAFNVTASRLRGVGLDVASCPRARELVLQQLSCAAGSA